METTFSKIKVEDTRGKLLTRFERTKPVRIKYIVEVSGNEADDEDDGLTIPDFRKFL